eukprot:TRINITY_DN66564_c5_g1_i1.p2 TRINITY_DN66564_c5_g1~~TRINITY_DN66564_c5_g1_i1.p2  ORF type:complete len:216 (+),score=117.42 TRINITY_DN66564_c5_g1_i1:162-809(+)
MSDLSPFDDMPQDNDAPAFDDPFAPVDEDDEDADVQEIEAAPTQGQNDDPFGDAFGDDGGDNAQGLPSLGGDDQGGDDPFAAVDDQADGAAGGDVAQEDAGPVETPLSRWEAQRAVELEERARAAEERKQKFLEEAKNDVTEFYRKQEEALAKTQANNKVEEENMKKDQESLMKNGTVWEKVAKLVNLSVAGNEQRDIARMRSLLVQLKNEKEAE